MLVYPAIISKPDHYYTIKFPDVPEAMTQGETLTELYEKAKEVLGFALEDYSEIPEPSSLETVKENHPGLDYVLIENDLAPYHQSHNE